MTVEYLRLLASFALFLCTSAYGMGGMYGSCMGGPLSTLIGGFTGGLAGGYGGGYGGYGNCGMGSIFHHWTCCPYNQIECCIQFETWVIVCFVIGGCLMFLCFMLCIVGCLWTAYKRNYNK